MTSQGPQCFRITSCFDDGVGHVRGADVKASFISSFTLTLVVSIIYNTREISFSHALIG